MATPVDAMIQRATQVLEGMAVAFVLIGWFIVGIMFLMAIGNSEKFTNAKRALFWVIIGTVVIIIGAGGVGMVRSAFGI